MLKVKGRPLSREESNLEPSVNVPAGIRRWLGHPGNTNALLLQGNPEIYNTTRNSFTISTEPYSFITY